MFPAGSLAQSDLQSDRSENALSNSPRQHGVSDANWLQSSTYVAQTVVHTTDTAHHTERRLREKKRRSHVDSRQKQTKIQFKTRSFEKVIFLEDLEGVEQSDAYRLDRSSNREIYTFGCIYEKHVSKFPIKPKMTILGFRTLRVCDLKGNELTRKIKGIRKSRYFSKRSRTIISKVPQPLASESCSQSANPRELTFTFDSGSQTAQIKDSTDRILTLCEELNRQVYNKPTDLRAWIRLIDMQSKEAAFVHLSDTSTKDATTVSHLLTASDRRLILKKQLSMIDRAISSNPGSLFLKISSIRLGEFAAELEAHGTTSVSGPTEMFQPERIARDWAQLAFTYPQLAYVWRGYLAHLMSKYASPLPLNQTIGGGLFSRIDGVFKRALSTLSGIISGRLLSHRPQPDTAEQTIDLLADYCHWLVHAGHSERALALWQAVVEFNCFRPAELIGTPTDQCLLEFELYWSSGAARFGQPGSEFWRSWHKINRQGQNSKSNENKLNKNLKKSSSGVYPLEEIQADATCDQMRSKWVDLSEKLKSISNSCEDALIQCTNESLMEANPHKPEFEVVPAVLSSAVATDQWVRRGAVPSLTGSAPIGKSRAVMYRRGKAWVGLERAREAVGWLPSDSLNPSGEPVEEEDPDRLVLFDDIKACVLELHVTDDRTAPATHKDKQTRLTQLQQRLLLQCLEFLGAYEPGIASKYQLPSDLRVVHDINLIGPIERQNLLPFLINNFTATDGTDNLTGSHQTIWNQTRRCVLDTAIAHAARVQSWTKTSEIEWQAALGRIRFHVAVNRLLEGMQLYHLPCKTVTATWRKFGRHVMSLARNQHHLDLWYAYASGFWRAATLLGTYTTDQAEVDALLSEARRIFDTALGTYPIPNESASNPDMMASDSAAVTFLTSTFAPRLEFIQKYIDLELGVSPGAGVSKHIRSCEPRAVHLLAYAAVGGTFTPTDDRSSLRPSVIVKTSHAYGKWLELMWRLLVSLPEDSRLDANTHACLVDGLTAVAPTVAYLNVMFDLLTGDQQNFSASLSATVGLLNRIDHVRSVLFAPPTLKRTRWTEASFHEPSNIPQRVCSRKFISLAVGGLSAFCALRQRNRSPLLGELFRVWHPEAPDRPTVFNAITVDLLFPSQFAYLVPARVALDSRLFPLSLANASSCHGLLPPLFLSSLIQRLNHFKEQVAQIAAHTHVEQAVAGPKSANPPQQISQDIHSSEYDSTVLSGHNLDLLVGCLPAALDLFVLALELERWTSLLAVSSSGGLPIRIDSTSSQRVRNAFERTVRASPFLAPMLTEDGGLFHISLASTTPSFRATHLRLVVWRAYMAFAWMSGIHAQGQQASSQDPRQKRQAVKAVFYRAIEDLPWAKVLYTDLARYCPEDVEEVVDLLSERELRLRTPLEEIDLLLSAKPSSSEQPC